MTPTPTVTTSPSPSVTEPENGYAAVRPDGTVRYTPAAGFTGTDTFDYTVSDGEATDTAR